MAEKDFFPPEFIGRVISFPTIRSSWKLTAKLRERNGQLTYAQTLRRPDLVSEVYGTFLCQNCDNEHKEAIMRVVMQIPYAGTELARAEDRAQQARLTPPEEAGDMLHTLALLNECNTDIFPRLMGIASLTQLDTDFVPGGFFLCVLLEKLPGRRLGPWFWSLGREKRDIIRHKFKNAWVELVAVTRYIPTSGLDRLFWDPRTGRLAFYDLLTGYKLEPGDDRKWTDIRYIYYEMAKAPGRYTYLPPDEDPLVTEDWGW